MAETVFRILLVDDDANTRRVHSQFVERLGYEVETAVDGIEALAKLAIGVDLILLDAEMPHMDGFSVAQRIRATPDYAHLPIVMVTGLTTKQDRRRALEVGINDYLTKPLDPEELQLRTKWLLELKSAHDRLRDQTKELERMVERRTAELRATLEEVIAARRDTYDAHLDTIRKLTIAAEYKDHDTRGHIERIGLYSASVARGLGLASGEVETIRHAAAMHDIGKLGIPDRILLKPGPLDDHERTTMQSHTTLGARMLADSKSVIVRLGETIALAHHERWDGRGYPRGLAAQQIPLEARICAVVDFFDALTMDRPYRKAVPLEQVIGLMESESGAHFDPDVLDAFLEVRGEIVEIRANHLFPDQED